MLVAYCRPDVDELARALGRMAARAPQEEQRHGDLPVLVGGVHGEIAGRARAIVAARARDRLQRVAAHVLGERAVGEKAEPRAAADDHAALQEIFRRHRADQALGKRLRLRHEAPVPGADRPALGGVRPHVVVRHDVHQAHLEDALGMVHAHAVRGARAAVVPRHVELAVAQLVHDLQQVLRHRAEAVVDVLGPGFGQRAVAVAAQIGQDHVVVLARDAPRSGTSRCDSADCRGRGGAADPSRRGAGG